MGLNTEAAKGIRGGGGPAPRGAAPRGAAGVVANVPSDTGNIGGRSPIGVPADHRVFRQGPLSDTGNLLGTGPRYYAGDELEPAGRDPMEIANLQRRLEGAGILGGKYRVGYWDNNTKNAYKRLLGYANQRGQAWDEALGEIQATGGIDGGGRRRVPYQLKEAFVQKAYTPPDYEALKQGVHETFKKRLNRDPEPYELVLFANQLVADYRRQFDVGIDAERRNFEARQRMLESGHAFDPEAEGLHVAKGQVAGTTEPEVDPVARFEAALRARLGPTMDALESEDEQRQIMGAVLGSMGALGDII